jgi:hypothetical protein
MAFHVPVPEDSIFDDQSRVVVEIYKITCAETGKSYIGQAVSHILNHGRYRRYGSIGRFKSHVSEATTNTKAKQCNYLNNAIRKYGQDKFSVELLFAVKPDHADEAESQAIELHQSLFPDGYNLKTGGKRFVSTEESRKNNSNGTMKVADKLREDKYKDVYIPNTVDPTSLLKPLYRDGKQYGWSVQYRDKTTRLKSDFGGSKRPLEESKQRALEFIRRLQEQDKVIIQLDQLTLQDKDIESASGQSAAKLPKVRLVIVDREKVQRLNGNGSTLLVEGSA